MLGVLCRQSPPTPCSAYTEARRCAQRRLSGVALVPSPSKSQRDPAFFSASVGQSPASRTNGHSSPLWQVVAPVASLAAVPPAVVDGTLLADAAGASAAARRRRRCGVALRRLFDLDRADVRSRVHWSAVDADLTGLDFFICQAVPRIAHKGPQHAFAASGTGLIGGEEDCRTSGDCKNAHRFILSNLK